MSEEDRFLKKTKSTDNDIGFGKSKCPRCGLSKSPSVACPKCFPTVASEQNIKVIPDEQSPFSENPYKNHPRYSQDRNREIKKVVLCQGIAFGMIIIIVIATLSPFGAFGYLNRVFTTMGNGLHFDPNNGCPAVPVEYHGSHGTIVRWYSSPENAPMTIGGMSDFSENLIVRSTIGIVFTVVIPILYLVYFVMHPEEWIEKKGTIKELLTLFVIWLFIWGVFTGYPLWSNPC